MGSSCLGEKKRHRTWEHISPSVVYLDESMSFLRRVARSWPLTQRWPPSPPSPLPLSVRRFSSDSQGSLFSSFLGKIKNVFKSGEPTEDPPPPHAAMQSPSLPDFTLMTFADELKKVRRIESITKLIKTQSSLSDNMMNVKIENFEAVLRALSKHDPMGENLEQKHKASVAAECGCSVQEINGILAKYEWMKAAHVRLQQMHAKGEAVPKTLEDVKKLLIDTSPRKYNPSQSTVKNEVSRNASCPCGSGKKYKRCCGRGV